MTQVNVIQVEKFMESGHGSQISLQTACAKALLAKDSSKTYWKSWFSREVSESDDEDKHSTSASGSGEETIISDDEDENSTLAGGSREGELTSTEDEKFSIASLSGDEEEQQIDDDEEQPSWNTQEGCAVAARLASIFAQYVEDCSDSEQEQAAEGASILPWRRERKTETPSFPVEGASSKIFTVGMMLHYRELADMREEPLCTARFLAPPGLTASPEEAPVPRKSVAEVYRNAPWRRLRGDRVL
mmetsp:Transcript_124796/g.216454  ORF Transcript_124796/g.216454 Transcript_124796/m.216454 type:complete len:245 (+) Transcript_124796:126-860(+)